MILSKIVCIAGALLLIAGSTTAFAQGIPPIGAKGATKGTLPSNFYTPDASGQDNQTKAPPANESAAGQQTSPCSGGKCTTQSPPQAAQKNQQRVPAGNPKSQASPQALGYRMSAQGESQPLFDSSDAGKTILPETVSHVYLSNSDVNRFVCHTDIKDIVYSKEKGITVRIADRNAFVKFQVLKTEDKREYAAEPAEFFIVCGEEVFNIVAVPKHIPSQTIRLGTDKGETIKKNTSLYQGLPFEKKVIDMIKRVYGESIPDSFTVSIENRKIASLAGLDIVLRRSVTIDGEGLRVKEFYVTAKEGRATLKEIDFLKNEFAIKAVAVSIDNLHPTTVDPARVFIVEQVTESGTGGGAL